MYQPNEIASIYKAMISQPLVPLTIRIAVAGHRNLLTSEIDRICNSIKKIYFDIDRLSDELSNNYIAKNIYSHNPKIIRLISSLAEGADRLCIREDLVSFHHELSAILPFEKKEYEKDFSPKNSVVDIHNGTLHEFNQCLQRVGYNDISHDNSQSRLIELDGLPSQRTQAYKQCSKVLVNHCDILIAVYDGMHDNDEGTAATVNYAIEQGIPVIHISTLPNVQTTIRSSSFFDDSNDAQIYTEKILIEELEKLFLFTDILKKDDIILNRFTRYIDETYLEYCHEDVPDFNNNGPIKLKKDYKNLRAKSFNYFIRFFSKNNKIEKLKKDLQLNYELPLNNKYDELNNKDLSSHRIYSSFIRADKLASYYSNVHRSTFLLIYLLGALALIAASCSLAFIHDHKITLIFVIVELFLLVSIYFLYIQDHLHEYHGRWLEYRCLAEFLRPAIYLNLLGKGYTLFTKKNTNNYTIREMVGHQKSSRRWITIYTQTILRWSGFSHCQLNTENKSQTINFINNSWLKGQINYHIHNASKMKVIAHHLGRWSFFLFFATVTAVLTKLIITSFDFKISTFSIALCTAIFPIIATTLFAIRNHAEFDISAQRSLSMRSLLISHHVIIDKNKENSSDQLCDLLYNISNETINEATEWLEIYEVKETEPS